MSERSAQPAAAPHVEDGGREAERVSVRAWLIAAGILVPLMLVLEWGGIRRVATALPSPRRDVFAHHFYQASRGSGGSGRARILILGSSMAIRGLDAAAMERALGACAAGAGPEVIHLGLWENREREKYLQTLQLLGHRPVLVVYTVSCNDLLERDLDDEESFVSSTDTSALYRATGRGQPAHVAAKNLFYGTDLGQYRYLVGWRLRQLAKELPAAVRLSEAERSAYFRLAVEPYPKDRAEPDEFCQWLESRRRIYSSPAFTTEGPSRVFLEAAVRAWREAGSQVLLVNMPVYPSLMEAYREGTYESFLSFVRGVADGYGCRLLDAHRPGLFGEEAFYNSVHLNRRGQRELTRRAVEQIRQVLDIGGGPCS